jgi:hypothetical protein
MEDLHDAAAWASKGLHNFIVAVSKKPKFPVGKRLTSILLIDIVCFGR